MNQKSKETFKEITTNKIIDKLFWPIYSELKKGDLLLGVSIEHRQQIPFVARIRTQELGVSEDYTLSQKDPALKWMKRHLETFHISS